jgi:hypothetical protein|tara:strand:- start:610 stop:1290 length:681 start_codon:yes stop_codon:yes gene_type:complete
MEKNRLKEIISEEVRNMLEVSMSRKFMKAVEALQKIQLAQQQLRKAFVAEKDVKKKEKLKQDIIKMHKVVQKAESDFNSAIKSEPIGDMDEGLWANIHAKRKRGERPAKKGEKGYPKTLDIDEQKDIQFEEVQLTESATDTLADDIGGKVYNAFGGGSAEAQKTNKTFDDGVPVLKYIARAPKKRVKLPKKFRVVVDERYGWYYYFDKGNWYGIDKKKYSTPPFEY